MSGRETLKIMTLGVAITVGMVLQGTAQDNRPGPDQARIEVPDPSPEPVGVQRIGPGERWFARSYWCSDRHGSA